MSLSISFTEVFEVKLKTTTDSSINVLLFCAKWIISLSQFIAVLLTRFHPANSLLVPLISVLEESIESFKSSAFVLFVPMFYQIVVLVINIPDCEEIDFISQFIVTGLLILFALIWCVIGSIQQQFFLNFFVRLYWHEHVNPHVVVWILVIRSDKLRKNLVFKLDTSSRERGFETIFIPAL